jgi:hypothetical protein
MARLVKYRPVSQIKQTRASSIVAIHPYGSLFQIHVYIAVASYW